MITPAEQQAFEDFGEAWRQMKVVEKAIEEGNGVSFLHHQAAARMQTKAIELKEIILQGKTPTSRQEANRQLIELIRAEVERNPNLRFGQLLSNLQIVQKGKDPFYEESLTTVMRVMGREVPEIKPTAQTKTEEEISGVPIYQLGIDSGCSGNPGDGNWKVILKEISEENPKITFISGKARQTTSQRMQLRALLEGLCRTPPNCIILVIADSKSIDQSTQQYLSNWKVKNPLTANNQPLTNPDLWEQINPLLAERNVSFEWINTEHPEKEITNQLTDKARNP